MSSSASAKGSCDCKLVIRATAKRRRKRRMGLCDFADSNAKFIAVVAKKARTRNDDDKDEAKNGGAVAGEGGGIVGHLPKVLRFSIDIKSSVSG